MSYETAFDELLTSTVTYATRASKNIYGEPTFSTVSSTFKARIVDVSTQVRDQQGNVVQVRTVAWVASTGTILATGRITLPDGSTPPIAAVSRYPDEDGTHHHKIKFGH